MLRKTAIKRKKGLRKESKQKISLIQRKLWQECKRIIRARYGNTCYTCDQKNLAGSNWHTGHMWPKASLGAWLKYDLRILRPQCYNCNINLGGNGAIFYARMTTENGTDYMENLTKERRVEVRAYDHYTALLERYKDMPDGEAM